MQLIMHQNHITRLPGSPPKLTSLPASANTPKLLSSAKTYRSSPHTRVS